MNRLILSGLICLLLMGVGCELPQARQDAFSDIEGLTLADLQAEQTPQLEQSLLTFNVLTYTLDTDAIETLDTIMESLSREDVRYDNPDAFRANGFSIGLATHEQGARLAGQIQSAGAMRITRGSLVIPPNSNEILYSVPVFGSPSVAYSTSEQGIGGATLSTGQMGWVFAAKQNSDRSASDAIAVSLCPAFWEIGASDLRLLAGQEPYQFHFFDVGRVAVTMQPGQVCVLGPERLVTEQETLNRMLFEQPRRSQVRFFVIIYGGPTGD